jgi:cell division protein ZapA (FtsZ GTPase activity inhibitor)
VKKTITLELAGASYRLNVGDDEEHVRKLAEIVNERVAALGPKAAQCSSPGQLLAMAALSLADEWLTCSNRVRAVEDTTRRAIVNAIARIDRRLAADLATPDA